MPSIGNTFLKLLQTALYAIIFCCSAIILGVYSYYLAILADRDIPIAGWKKAVEGLSGAAVLYMIFAVLLTCFLGGVRIFAFLAIVLDVLFTGAMIAIAVLTRDGAHSCQGNVDTPLGSGPSNSNSVAYGKNGFGFGDMENSTYAPDLQLACRLNKVAFAVSIIAAGLFLICAGLQLGIARKHQKEKRIGPSPANGYTSGSKRHFWQRRSRAAPIDPEGGITDPKYSHDTGYTGAPTATYDSTGRPVSGGFHTGPTGSYAAPHANY